MYRVYIYISCVYIYCVYIYMYTFTYYTDTHTYIHTCMHACMHTYIHTYVRLRYVLLRYVTVQYITYITYRRTDGRTAGPPDRPTDRHTYMTQVGGFRVRWSHCQVLTMCRHYREKLLLVTREVDALRRDQALQMPLVGRSNGFR